MPPSISAPVAPSGQCALPVYSGASTLQTAFLLYPSNVLVAPQTITGWQGEGAYYDTAAERWLPVGPNAVSPDGLQLAYAEYDMLPPPAAGMAGDSAPHAAGTLVETGRVHVVDARTGKDTVVFSGSPTYAIAGFTAAGIYLTQAALTMDGAFFTGLLLLPVSGGTPVPVAGGTRQLDRAGWTVLDGAAWGTEFKGGGNPGMGNEVVRLDLQTGAASVWLTMPEGIGTTMIGFDAHDDLLVTTYQSVSSGSTPAAPTELVAVSSPQKVVVLWQTTDPNAPAPFGPVFDDSHGAWMGSMSSVSLDANGTITKVAVDLPGAVGIGGTCQ